MKKEFTIVGLIIISLSFLSSCGTWTLNKTSDFIRLNSLEDIEGIYFSRSETANYEYYRKNKETSYYFHNNVNALRLFEINANADFITISFEGKNKLKLSFYNDTISQTVYFEGKFKGKFFEIYHRKDQSIIPLIYSRIDVSRLRIGKTKKGKLLIKNFQEQSGNLLFLVGGYRKKGSYSFHPKSIFSDYMPTAQKEKWGYTNSQGEVIIPHIYDYTSVFEDSVARVKLDNKWGLIDKQGQGLTPFCYDYISPIDTMRIPLYQVKVGDKHGIINANGQNIIPPVYDEISYSVSNYNMVRVTLGKKHGYASLEQGVIIPAIYDKMIHDPNQNSNNKWSEERDGKMYQINKEEDGYYEYELKEVRYGLLKNIARIDVRYEPVPETRRKLR